MLDEWDHDLGMNSPGDVNAGCWAVGNDQGHPTRKPSKTRSSRAAGSFSNGTEANLSWQRALHCEGARNQSIQARTLKQVNIGEGC